MRSRIAPRPVRLAAVLLLALALPGCGGDGSDPVGVVADGQGDPTADLDDGSDVADELGDGASLEAEGDGSADDDPSGDPRYIIYMQPATSNPLYGYIQGFINRWPYHPWGNTATFYPPHVSMTGFFSAPVSQQPFIISKISSAIGAVKTPFGQPRLSSVTRSKSADGSWVVRLNVKQIPRYHQFIDKLVAGLGIQGSRKLVRNYHISLGVVASKTTADRIFADAKVFFPSTLLHTFSASVTYRRWDIVLYRARGGGVPGVVEVARWHVNP